MTPLEYEILFSPAYGVSFRDLGIFGKEQYIDYPNNIISSIEETSELFAQFYYAYSIDLLTSVRPQFYEQAIELIKSFGGERKGRFSNNFPNDPDFQHPNNDSDDDGDTASIVSKPNKGFH